MITGMTSAVLSGAALGLSAGVTPGPLLALVIAQTLTHGPREGGKVALAPLLTDAPSFWRPSC
jgi:threonine/homoserine/homoserine lactone efflux protein